MIVLWTILKIILWVLLVILLALLTIVSVLIFMPIVYEAEIRKEESLCVQATITILYFFQVEYRLKDETDQTKVFIFGRKFSSKNTKKERSKGKQQEESKSKQSSVSKENNIKQNKIKQEPLLKENNPKKKVLVQEDKKEEKEQNKQQTSTFEKIKILWGLPERKHFLKETLVLFKQWIKVILPIIRSFKIKIGLDEPDQTGKLLAVLAFLYPWYYSYGDIDGVFDKKGIWGEVELEGKISLFLFLKPLILFLIKRPVRKYIVKMIKAWREDEEYGI